MKIGLFVVGQSEVTTLPILIRKVLDAKGVRPAIHTRIVQQGDMLSPRKMEAYLNTYLKQHSDTTKLFICLDTECTPPNQTRTQVAPVEQALAKAGFQPPPHYVLVVHALESWLADEEALRAVLGGARAQVRISENTEQECRPAELLKREFRRNNRSFQKTVHDPRIADHIDPDKLTQRSPSFAEFRQLIET